ncbi:MAG: hypothetical protein ACJ71Q_17890 [Terriglobales bacterium]
MTPMELQDRAQYLSLALFAQNVISALMEYVDEDKIGKLRPSLSDALASVKQAEEQTSNSTPNRVIALNSYEQLRTIDEVWDHNQRTKAVALMTGILSSPQGAKTKARAEELISLFSKLQSQALWNYEQPTPVSPSIMQRLCRLA